MQLMNRFVWQARSLPRQCVVATIALFGGVACTGNDAAPDDSDTSAVAEWAVTPEPALQIGVVEGDPDYQFHSIVSMLRLPDGRIAVLNAGSHELRIYTPDGRLLVRTGRRGGGPGEFQNPRRLYLLADTLAVYDAGLGRMSLHTLDGHFTVVRDVATAQGKFALDEWLHDHSWIDGPPLGRGRAPVIAAVATLPPPDTADAYRYIRVTPFGHLWVRQPASPARATRSWLVYDLAGANIARVGIPADLEVHDIGADYLLGRARDSLGVEYVRLHRLVTRGAALSPYPFPRDTAIATAPPADSTAAVIAELRGALRMLAGLQEVYYSNPASQYRYADDHRKLEGNQQPAGVVVRIVNAHERGWTAVAIHRATGLMCGMSYGVTPPVGWTPGVATCP